MPIYVTRPTGNGGIGYFALSPRAALTVFLLILANAIGWSIFGLLALAAKAVDFLG
jgi:hypothetical protein